MSAVVVKGVQMEQVHDAGPSFLIDAVLVNRARVPVKLSPSRGDLFYCGRYLGTDVIPGGCSLSADSS